jgi:hypothetical protein
MKLVEIKMLVSHGDFASSPEYKQILLDLTTTIDEIAWGDKNLFKINPIRKGNGVSPIRQLFTDKLVAKGWFKEIRMTLAKGMNPGPIDAIIETKFGVFAVEWETGNISSSHRALNKIAVGVLQGQLIGGILILPNRALGKYLTDRIGNYEELAPYFPMYENLNLEGTVGVISVTHDEIDENAPVIMKGSDGNALKLKI